MDNLSITQIVFFIIFFGVGLWHHGRYSYKKGREQGTDEAINLVLAILTTKGIITVDEAEEIIRNDEAKVG
jgi:hypothetical protein